MELFTIKIKLNGQWRTAGVTATETLLTALREKMSAFDVKNGCEQGDCGACAVLLDGKAVNSCLTLAVQADGREVTTLKGLGSRETPHPLQMAFVEKGAVQCGFCSAGMIISAKALLDEQPSPSREQIREGMSGNLCRCTGYEKIVEAVEEAAEKCRS